MRANTRKAILLTVLAGIVAYVAFDSAGDKLSTGSASPVSAKSDGGKEAVSSSQGAGSRERAGRFALPGRTPLGEPRAELFGPHSWQPPAPKSAAVIAKTPTAPSPPPMPYKFVGTLVQDGKLQVLLAKGDAVIPVRVGESIDGGYRVESIGEDQITLIYLPLGKKEVIPFFSSLLPAMAGALARAASDQVAARLKPAAAASDADGGAVPRAPVQTAVVVTADPDRKNAPAQLLWHGPNQVKLGTEFSVVLRVTSAQPVRASPMQLKFDPSLLQAVAVKPGRFFGPGDRNFSYRVGPDGSIFVGASNQGPVPPADAEFLVLTFRPLKLASVAELSIASLNLQGPAGQPIAFGQPEAFRTAISP